MDVVKLFEMLEPPMPLTPQHGERSRVRRLEKAMAGYRPNGQSAGKGLDVSSNLNDHPVRGVGRQGQGVRSREAVRRMIWSELGGNVKRSAKPGRFATQLQNLPRGEAVRGIYVAPPEHVLFVCDYSQIELCALAQSCLTRFGKSRMAEVINSGEDVHRWFGNIIKENDHRPAEKKEGVDFRALAKVPNFGQSLVFS